MRNRIDVRRRSGPAPTALLAALALPATLAVAGVPTPPDLVLDTVATGLATPVVVTHAGDGSGRLFIVEKAGRIRIVDNGTLLPTPFLDIDPEVNSTGFEQGLLGLAFDPDYATNGDFYVYYTRADNATVLAHYSASPPSSNIAGTTGTVLWSQSQPAANHNGGQLAFGPDGHLYIAVGDGGIQGDPNDYAQSLDTWLGKILRISVDGSVPYSVPPENPYVGIAGALDEIWQSGLRNPWRFSFDRLTGDLFIGDVGFQTWEEIDVAAAGGGAGINWGWRCYEGAHPFNTTGCGPIEDYEMPILEYAHSLGRCSVTGGYRYRGLASPSLTGAYLFGDYCTGDVWAAVEDPGTATWTAVDLDFPQNLSALTTFGEDEGGEFYVVAGGTVFRVREVGAVFSDDFETGTAGSWSSTTP